jgi:alpha-D-xyloside xylohydrolase
MIAFTPIAGGLEARLNHEVLRIEAWGEDSVRVRVAQHHLPERDLGALTTPPPAPAPEVTVDPAVGGGTGRVVQGRMSVTVSVPKGVGGPQFMTLTFGDAVTGKELLAEHWQHFHWPGPRSFDGTEGGSYHIVQEFQAYDGEAIFGLGQHMHGQLDHKGVSLDLVQRNANINIPFYYSNRGYGFLWNNPGVGQVDFAANRTRWTLKSSDYIDYWVTAGDTPAAVLAHYADAVGHSPEFPEWALGMWQCKLRYLSQAELLEVVHGYQSRGWPLSVIVSDYMHFKHLGDWDFDPAEYPDVGAMMRELDAAGVHLMVSTWPVVCPRSKNYQAMLDRGMFIGHKQGLQFEQQFPCKDHGEVPMRLYDATNPAARDYLWGQMKASYFDVGVRAFWLDLCEPEVVPGHTGILTFYAGPGDAVINLYPRDHAKAFREGAAAAGDPDVVLLSRSAWAGQAKYGTAIWSGDIEPTWESLRQQVRAGLSIGLSGMPWWTTDIGGFSGGVPEDPDYQELFARWFEFGTFCPLMRLHGHREPRPASPVLGGGPNEPWSYGPRVEAIAGEHIVLRERMRPYLRRIMAEASATGLPPMRPLFVDYPEDPAAWAVDDAYLFGPDLVVAPVLAPGVVSRPVYLPAGTSWTELHTGVTYAGGQTHDVPAPYEYIPVFTRDGAALSF